MQTIEIDFKGKRAHCASSNMKFGKDGVLRSSQPIGPKDFAASCFPEKGIYEISAFGVNGSKTPVKGSIVVE